MKKLDAPARVLLLIGGLNWGLVGIFHFDLIAALVGRHFGETSPVSSVIYILVGLVVIYEALSWKAIQRRQHGTYSPAGI